MAEPSRPRRREVAPARGDRLPPTTSTAREARVSSGRAGRPTTSPGGLAEALADEAVFDGVDGVGLAAHRRTFAEHGLTVLGPPALRAPWFEALREEARARMLDASWALSGSSTRGEIEQLNRRARLGAVARAYLSSEAIASVLVAVTGERLAPSWSASCYTRYTGPGERMGEHCDKADTCTYNVLTYLEADWSPTEGPGPGLSLHVFRGDNVATGLAARVSARANRALLLHGSRHAHLRPALAAGERLLMLAGCFRRR